MHFLYLPLGVLAIEKLLKNANNLGESSKVDLKVAGDPGVVVAKLGVEVLAVRASTHGGAEDGLDEEAVMRLEGAAVGGAEGVGELFVGLGRIGSQGEAGELEATG